MDVSQFKVSKIMLNICCDTPEQYSDFYFFWSVWNEIMYNFSRDKVCWLGAIVWVSYYTSSYGYDHILV